MTEVTTTRSEMKSVTIMGYWEQNIEERYIDAKC